MSFFEPPAPRPAEPGWAAVPWHGPPDNAIGAPVAVRLVLARTDAAAVLVNGLTAFQAGFELELAIRRRTYPPEHDHWASRMPLEMHRASAGELPDDLLRFGIEFSDGRKVTTLDSFPGPDAPAGASADRPVLLPQGGGGDGRRWDQRYWVWPLPPPGPLAFVCEWPALGIEVTRLEIDAQLVLDAAGRAEVLWPDEPRPPGAIGWTSRTITARLDDEAT